MISVIVMFMMRMLLLFAFSVCGTTYFYVDPGTPKCFIEFMLGGQHMVVHYNHQDNSGAECSMTFKDKTGQVLTNRAIPHKSPTGVSSFLAHEEAEYTLCVQCKGSRWQKNEPVRWSLVIDHGDEETSALIHGTKNDDVARSKASLQVLLRRLNLLHQEGQYQRRREMEWITASHRVHNKTLWLSVAVVIFATAMTVLQIYHLRNHFQAEKLV